LCIAYWSKKFQTVTYQACVILICDWLFNHFKPNAVFTTLLLIKLFILSMRLYTNVFLYLCDITPLVRLISHGTNFLCYFYTFIKTISWQSICYYLILYLLFHFPIYLCIVNCSSKSFLFWLKFSIQKSWLLLVRV